MITKDLLAKLRLAATVAIATTAGCEQKREPAPLDAAVTAREDAHEAAALVAVAVEDAAPVVEAGATVDAGVDAGPRHTATPARPDGGEIGLGFIGTGMDTCPGCGMGGRLGNERGLGAPPPKGMCSMPPTEPEVENAKPRFLACYQKGLAANPTAGGKVVLLLRVSEAGRVDDVQTVSSTLNAPEVDACLRAVAKTLHLKPGERKLTVPLLFRHDHG